MKNFLRLWLLPLCLCVVRPWVSAGQEVPASLAPPAGQTLAFVLHAKGVQIYECRPTQADPAKYEWAFKAPEANLFETAGRVVGKHSAGPTWELDGGKITGRVKAKADAPDGKAIPWLLLEVATHEGKGKLTDVVSVQRVDTVGGLPPAEEVTAAKAGQVRRVEYTATYRFFVAKP